MNLTRLHSAFPRFSKMTLEQCIADHVTLTFEPTASNNFVYYRDQRQVDTANPEGVIIGAHANQYKDPTEGEVKSDLLDIGKKPSFELITKFINELLSRDKSLRLPGFQAFNIEMAKILALLTAKTPALASSCFINPRFEELKLINTIKAALPSVALYPSDQAKKREGVEFLEKLKRISSDQWLDTQVDLTEKDRLSFKFLLKTDAPLIE